MAADEGARRYGAAIWGAGWVAGEHIKAYCRNPCAEVVAIGSRTPEGAARKREQAGLSADGCAVYDDLGALLADRRVDVVSICTPNDQHAEQAIAAAQAGKHLVIEKPPAITLEGLRAMRDAVRAAGVRTIVSFVLHWNPLLRTVRALRDDGALGKIVLARADYWHHIHPEEWSGYHWARTRAHGGSMMLAGGCHAVDAVRWLVGTDVTEVMSLVGPVSSGGGYEYPGTAAAVLRFADGALGQVSVCVDAYLPYAFNLEVLGDQGSVRNNRLFTRKLPGQTDWATLPTILPDSGDVTHHPFQEEIDHFVAALQAGEEATPNLEDAAKTTEVCLAADLSAAEGRPVRLPLLP